MQCDVLCIGAGKEQTGPIRLARSLGLRVVAIDSNPAAEGLKYADYPVARNPSNAAFTLDLAKSCGVKFLLPVPLGRMLLVAGEIISELGLPGPSKRAAMLSTDKLEMRRTLREAGLSQPYSELVKSGTNISELLRGFSGQLIFKPRFGSGSRGVALVRDEDEAKRCLEEQSGGDLLAEEPVKGTEFGVDGYIVGNTFGILCIRKKEITPPPERLGIGYLISPEIHAAAELYLQPVLKQAVKALDFTDCLWHADVIVSDDYERSWIIEASCRPSGYFLSEHLVPAVSGVNPYKQIISFLSGLTKDVDFQPASERSGLCRMVPYDQRKVPSMIEAGAFDHVDGLVKLDIDLMTNPPDLIPRAIVATVGDSLDQALHTFSVVKTMLAS